MDPPSAQRPRSARLRPHDAARRRQRDQVIAYLRDDCSASISPGSGWTGR